MKQQRLRACCVNFKTVRKFKTSKASFLSRLLYAINPLPISWKKKWEEKKEEQRIVLDQVFITRPQVRK